MDEPILSAEELSVGYGGRAVLERVALSVRPGEILTLIGPNGAGKSTVLKTIARQLAPVAGTVYLTGRDLSSLKERDTARIMSVMLTERFRGELMTCEDVVSAGRYPYTGTLGLLSADDRKIVADSMEKVRVADLRDRPFDRISDGQRQRVLLARAVCQQPRVLVLDEPTSFLDVRHKLELLSLLKDLVRGEHLAVVLSLHELDLAQRISDRVLCIRDGAVDRCGPPEEIFSGGYIESLYGVEAGSYNERFGCVELPRTEGAPELFVIGGGGAGTAVYRRLQRRGVPFATGVLHENDLDAPAAEALAAECIWERAFEPVGAAALDRAAAVLARCRGLIRAPASFGTMNAGNAKLVEYAQSAGKRVWTEWKEGDEWESCM